MSIVTYEPKAHNSFMHSANFSAGVNFSKVNAWFARETTFRTKCFPSGPNLGRHWRTGYIFPVEHRVWNKISPPLVPTIAPFEATLHPIELRCILKSYAAATGLCCTLLGCVEPQELRCTLWAKLHCTLLSYAAPYWVTLHPSELRCTLLSYASL